MTNPFAVVDNNNGAVIPIRPPAGPDTSTLTTHDVQAQLEGVRTAADAIYAAADTAHVEFKGEKFRLADDTGIMPLLMFAAAAHDGLDSRDMAGLAAMYAMVRDCIADDAEWQRFVRHAVLTKAKADDLMTVVNQAVEILTARPQVPPGDSSAGRRTTSDGSKGSSSSPTPAPRPVPGMEGLVAVDDLAGLSTA